MSDRVCPVRTDGCPNDCRNQPCSLAETTLDMALDIYWANENPWLASRIDKLIEALRLPPAPTNDVPYGFWLGRDAADEQVLR